MMVPVMVGAKGAAIGVLPVTAMLWLTMMHAKPPQMVESRYIALYRVLSQQMACGTSLSGPVTRSMTCETRRSEAVA